MKKLFTLLMAVMFVSAAFAQNKEVSQINFTRPQIQKNFSLTMPAKHLNQSKDVKSFWFDYVDAMERYGFVMEGKAYPMSGDTTIYFAWSNSDPSASVYIGTGSYFDWSHRSWNDFYMGSSSPVPALWTSQDYTIDSVEITYLHVLGDSVNPTVKDTLVLSYVINLDEERASNWYSVDTITLDTLWWGSEIPLPVDLNTFSLTHGNNYLTLGENVQVIEQKVPIQADTVFDYTSVRVAAPEALQHLNCNILAVYYTYKAGPQAVSPSLMGTTANYFYYGYCEDPRSEYINGGDAPKNDLNTDFKVIEPNIVDYTGHWLHDYYGTTMMPGILLTGFYPEHSFIALHAVCEDCSVVDIPEIEEAVATIYPNPATSEINVITNTNEKVNVEMFNLVGQKVYSEQVVNSTKINVSNMKAGVYMLRVNNHTTKVVVK